MLMTNKNVALWSAIESPTILNLQKKSLRLSTQSWVNSRIHTWLCGASDNETSNKEQSTDKRIFHEKDYNIIPLCTIKVVSGSDDSSGKSQQNMNPNSLESNSIDMLRQLEPRRSEREATTAPNKEESQQVGMRDPYPMMQKMVQ